ncbi:protein SOSEKI 5 [Rutidosis leptorrhynchoides]|uniref:protein SOSEKI 5 n=1 Tax=Rutidosis leptorrhynchoides TaxID=125765 RepID=UPI003A9A2CD2
MEPVSRSSKPTTTPELHHLTKKWKDPRSAERSPEHTRVWSEPHPIHTKPRKVPVVYYLSRNGNLEHPHFIEIPLSSPDGLYLRDVIERLNSLRGKGMAALYSWSSKRSYKSGFVWHDLSENDYIYPVQGQEYVLKGSELVVTGGGPLISKTLSPESEKSGDDDFPVVRRRRNQSWSAIDLHEYKVSAGKLAADASTQTDDKFRRRRSMIKEIEEEEENENESYRENESSELSREEISSPPSDSSPETLESLMKADGNVILRPVIEDDKNGKSNPTVENKVKSSSVLMQLISCGSISFRDCGPGAYGKDNPGFSLISHYKSRMLPRGVGSKGIGDETVEDAVVLRKNRGIKKPIVTENKEYFSGSLIETKKEVFPAIKRSNSYTGNR